MTRGPIGTEIEAGPVPAWPRLAGARGALALAGLGLPALVVVAPFLGLPAGAATPSALSQFLLESKEQPGYTVSGHPTTLSTPSALLEGGLYNSGQKKNLVSALKKAGFVKAVEETISASADNEGFSLVMQFKNAAGAQAGATLFLRLATTDQAGTKPFSVVGVQGAKGVTVTGGAGGSANAYWTAGDCAFGTGIYDDTASSAKAVAAPVQAGIKSQAARIGTTCP